MSARNGNPKMQRAHFQLVADVLSDTLLTEIDRENLIRAFTARFTQCNDHFDSHRFYEASTKEARVK